MYLSDLNVQLLLGKYKIITNDNDHVKAFDCNPDVWKTQSGNEDFTY